MLDSKTLLQIVNTQLDVGKGIITHDSITIGVVVDTDDPLQNGRLRVFCPNLNDSPKKLHHIPWAVASSPLAGTISNSSFTRGAGKGPENTTGAVSYGFWGVPEQGALVLIAKIDGDERRRVWLGCVPSHQETHTLMHGRYEWGSGKNTPDGPLSSTKDPIEPYYSNALKAFNDEMDSREWKTRQAEYQACSVPEGNSIPAEELAAYLDEEYTQIAKAEQDKWVRDILGSHGYDWSSNKAVGSFLASKVYGWSTPGFHAISMDDRAFNNRIRIRSATGHQLLFDDTNERIYLSTNEGNNFVEFDSNGNIDIYSKKRISVHAEEDINFSTEESFRVKAKKGIYMYAGDTEGQEKLDDEKPEDGEIRFHSTGDTHLMVEKNLRGLVKESSFMEIGKSSFISIGENLKTQVESGIDFIVNDGDYNVALDGDYNHHASGNTEIFSGNDNKFQAVNDTNIFSYTGKVDIGSQLEMTLKAYEGVMSLDAISNNMKLTSNNAQNQLTMRNPSVTLFTVGNMITQSATEIAQQVYNGFGVIDGEPAKDGIPLGSSCLRIDGGVNIKFDDQAISMDAVDDVLFKVQNGISAVTGKIDTRISDVNKGLEQIEANVNDFMFTTQDALQTVVDNWLDPLPDGFTIPTFPTLPQLPSIGFPPIQLPDFNFDFCIDIADFVTIQDFNPIPNNMFGNINIDLGNWTLSTFKNWASRHKEKLDLSLNSFSMAKQTADTQLSLSIDQIEITATNTKIALGNLVDVSVTNNDQQIADYTLGINKLKDDTRTYNQLVDQYNITNGTNIERIVELENELTDHSRTLETLNVLSQKNSGIVNSFDYSDLQETEQIFADYLVGLNNI